MIKMYRLYALFHFFLVINLCLSQNWVVQDVDITGYGDNCIITDTQCHPHIVYNSSRFLKYAKWNGSSWEFQLLDSTVDIRVTKINLDQQDRPHIAYLKMLVNNCIQVIYTYYNGQTWQVEKIDSTFAGNYAASFGPRALDFTLSRHLQPYLSYSWIDLSDSVWQVRCASKRNDTWRIDVVWEKPLSFKVRNTKICLDTTGYPAIGFGLLTSPDMKYLYCAHFNGNIWHLEEVFASHNEGFNIHGMGIDRLNRIHLFYQQYAYLRYAVRLNSGWIFEHLGADFSGGCGDLKLCRYNLPHIVWGSHMALPGYLYKTGTTWNYETIDPQGCGLFPSLAIDRLNGKHASYLYYPLRYARRITTGIEKDEQHMSVSSLPKELSFSVPSPISPSNLKISYNLPKDGRVKLMLYDINGRMISKLKDKEQKSGYYTEIFNLRNHHIATGIYYLIFQSEQETKLKKLVIVK